MSTIKKIVDVAVAILQKPDGSFLLARRPEGKAYAGYWEFPGGKIEAGESSREALQRELNEEIGIEVKTAYPWLEQLFTYPHATVRLNFFRVTSWQGEPHGKENQLLSWQKFPDLTVSPVLPANDPILRALQLPHLYAISNATELGVEVFLQRLQIALQNGLRLLQIREKNWQRDDLRELAIKAIALAHAKGAKVLLNEDIELAKELGADGVQITSKQLNIFNKKPIDGLCAASCHNREELQRAIALGLDFVLLSPVLPTKSHPGAVTLGWDTFAKLTAESSIPVYALGGLTPEDLGMAWQKGGHGIALLRQAW